MSQVLHITTEQFRETVLSADRPVLVDFYADWCGPCRMMAPVLEKLVGELGERASIVKVNVDEEPKLAELYRVSSIPMLVLFRGGLVKRVFVGVTAAAELRKAIEEAAGTAGQVQGAGAGVGGSR